MYDDIRLQRLVDETLLMAWYGFSRRELLVDTMGIRGAIEREPDKAMELAWRFYPR
jgi:hypothetical protein